MSDFQPNLNEVSHFLKLIFAGLERWHDDETLQGLFRQHLICIFEFDFPEHYGEVLQALLQSCKAQKIQVNVIMDIINSFFTRSSCDRVESASQPDVFNQVRKFAANQKLFDFKSVRFSKVCFIWFSWMTNIYIADNGNYENVSRILSS